MATMHRKNISEIDWIYKNIQTPILLINQSDFSSLEIQDNIRMISCIERGSSNSRNMALNNAIGDICLIADDDVGYVDNAEEIINCAFRDNPSADIITFQIITPEGKPFNKGYPVHKQWHNSRSILRCASIEIAFRKDSIIQAGIKLDVDFGLGSKYRVHDEIIFLKDALDNNLKLLYIPIPIVIHPAESSGTDFNDHLIVSKGAAFVRLFGYKGMFLNILFAIKKHAEYSNKYSFLGFLMKMFEGSIKYIREDLK